MNANFFDTPHIDSLEVAPSRRDGPFVAYLKRIGAGSLTLSLLLHGAFVLVAIFVIWFQEASKPETPATFETPGGGGGSNGERQKMQARRNQMIQAQPKVRLTAINSDSSVVLPDPTTSLQSTDMLSSLVVGGGSLGKGGGLGGGVGTGVGPGMGAGRGPGTLKGFGAKFLGLTSTGPNVMFVIDTSGSMVGNCKPQGIAAIRKELSLAINAMASNTQFNIICFGQDADVFRPISVNATAENKHAAIKFFDFYYKGPRTRTEKFGKSGKDGEGGEFVGVKPEDVKGLEGTSGGSRMDLGLTMAFQRQASTVFLLSDGHPGTQRDGKKLDLGDLLKFIGKKHDEFTKGLTKTVINTISVNEEAEPFLRKVAAKFDGKHKAVKVDQL